MKQTKGRITYYNTVKSKQIDWLWYPYIPYGKITIIQGDPGEGKTTFILSLIAEMSNGGTLPFTNTPVEGVSIYQNTEDDIADTIKPRLDIHKANCQRICFIDKDEGLTLDDDSIEEAIKASGARLLVLDPIQSFVGENVDMNRANSIRPRMKKLKEMAERTGCAVVLIGHLNKNSGNKTNYRGLGSIDIPAAARSVLLVGKLDDQPNVRAVAQMKNNLAPIGKTLLFELKKGKVSWISESNMTADDLATGINPYSNTKEEHAMNLIRELLSEGAMPAKELYAIAGEQDIGERTLNMAKRNLHVQTYKEGSAWYWTLGIPEDATE